MDRERLVDLEGMIVYFSHKFSREESISTRFGRGIVYKGRCYDYSFVMKGRPWAPKLIFNEINPEMIVEIASLKEEQQSDVERDVADSIRAGISDSIKLTLSLEFFG